MTLKKGNFVQNPDFLVFTHIFYRIKSLHRVIIVLPGIHQKIEALLLYAFLSILMTLQRSVTEMTLIAWTKYYFFQNLDFGHKLEMFQGTHNYIFTIRVFDKLKYKIPIS